MGQSKSFYSACTAVRTNSASGNSRSFKGYVMCLKPGYAKTNIALQPSQGQNPAATEGVYEEYVITPTAVHEYSGDGIDRATGKPKVQNYAVTRFAPGAAAEQRHARLPLGDDDRRRGAAALRHQNI